MTQPHWAHVSFLIWVIEGRACMFSAQIWMFEKRKRVWTRYFLLYIRSSRFTSNVHGLIICILLQSHLDILRQIFYQHIWIYTVHVGLLVQKLSFSSIKYKNILLCFFKAWFPYCDLIFKQNKIQNVEC